MVLYSTSMGIVRETYAKCANVKQILRTLLIKFEERDVFMSNEYQQEIKDRMKSFEIQVPQLFVDGQYIGVSHRPIPIFLFSVWPMQTWGEMPLSISILRMFGELRSLFILTRTPFNLVTTKTLIIQ